MSKLNQIGVIGMGVMGANLAQNFASRNIYVSVYGRHIEKVTPVVEKAHAQGYKINGFDNLKLFVESLEIPRKIILMVPAGTPVDDMIESLLPFIAENDSIIDCGNSFWKDTTQREKYLETKKVNFVGCGVSGGSEGALKGPSIMPGGNPQSINQIMPFLELVAAKDFQGKACVTNVGLSAAGHFVKMVHNGIEYAMMQGIAEVYDVLKTEHYSNEEILGFFKRANQGDTKSYLLDITENIFQTKEGNILLVDLVSDVAKAKGTGGWTVQSAMELGVNTPTIAAAVFARIASAKNQFFNSYIDPNKAILSNGEYPEKEFLLEQLVIALGGVFLVSYLQGLDLITKANEEFDWDVDLKEIIRIWQGGCIIRSQMLLNLYEIVQNKIDVSNYVWAFDFISGIPLILSPVMTSSYIYLQTIENPKLSSNLIQAQRDYFGSHTYKRIDKAGDFTGGWQEYGSV
jgi:6-phosphogluconate dehydrogenase